MIANNYRPPFFLNATATTAIYTLSLHDALPISAARRSSAVRSQTAGRPWAPPPSRQRLRSEEHSLNSSHVAIAYAVFCLKKKQQTHTQLLHYTHKTSFYLNNLQ